MRATLIRVRTHARTYAHSCGGRKMQAAAHLAAREKKNHQRHDADIS